MTVPPAVPAPPGGAAAADEAPAAAGRTDGPAAPSSGPRRRWRRILAGAGAVVVVLAVAAGAFLAFGPAGLGPGPLVVASVSVNGHIPAAGTAMIVIPAGAAPGVPAVIDGVRLGASGKYGAPGVKRVAADTDPSCVGLWYPVTGPGGFLARCAPSGLRQLTGRLLPGRAGGARSAGLAVEVGPPGKSGCWAVSRVTIRYHVGHRHYTQTDPESLTVCTTD